MSENKTAVEETSGKPDPTAWYSQKLEKLKAQAGSDLTSLAALDLAAELDEPNILGVHRLIEIFGLFFIREKVAESIALYSAAAESQPSNTLPTTEAKLLEKATPTLTRSGKLRAKGGVFFYLMQGHCKNIRLDWQALKVPFIPENKPKGEGEAPLDQPPQKEGSVSTAKAATANQVQRNEPRAGAVPSSPVLPKPPVTTATPKPMPPAVGKATPNPQGQSQALKPNRLKAVLTGHLADKPRTNRDGLIELDFTTALSSTMPKGLPNSGGSSVRVLCTAKQWSKVSEGLQPDDRLIVEGEILTNTQPFLTLVCVKITTTRLEQSAKAKAPALGLVSTT